MSTKWNDGEVSLGADGSQVVADSVVDALDTGTDPLSRVTASATAALVVADVAWPSASRTWATLGFGETQSWLVMPTASRIISVYRLVLAQAATGTVQLYQGTALDDVGNVPLDAAFPLGAGVYVERDRHPIWTLASGTGLIVARANITTTLAYSVDFTKL